MKHYKKLLFSGLALLSLCNVQANQPIASEPASDQLQMVNMDALSEMLGYLIGSNMNGPGIEFSHEAVIRGIRKGFAGDEAPMSLEQYELQVKTLQGMAFEAQAVQNLKEAEEFLTENRSHAAIVEVEPGKLQYRVLEEGRGAVVAKDSSPLIHYTARHHSGKVFGTSAGGEPIVLPLDHAIPGFVRGIVGMKEGERRILYVHPDLGYQRGGSLPPNSLLVFEVEIVKADTKEPSKES